LAEACLHLAIAFVVAGTVIALIEIRAQQAAEEENERFRKQILADAHRALYGRLVPPEVFAEINSILHTDIVRSNCKYVITFLPPDKAMPDDSFIVRRQVAYTVTNLLNQQITFMARSFHSEDLEFSSETWKGKEYHLKLLVDGEEIKLEEGKNLTTGADFAKVEQAVPLGPEGSRSISLHGEEPALLTAGRISYLQATPVIGIEVTILNSYPEKIKDAEVYMNHPGRDQMRIDDLGHFVLNRAFLPGQGFQVIWKLRKEQNLLLPDA
jgi:hypothetical protein